MEKNTDNAYRASLLLNQIKNNIDMLNSLDYHVVLSVLDDEGSYVYEEVVKDYITMILDA